MNEINKIGLLLFIIGIGLFVVILIKDLPDKTTETISYITCLLLILFGSGGFLAPDSKK